MSRRFAVSKHNESKISIRESLDIYTVIAITFDDAKPNHINHSFIPIFESDKVTLIMFRKEYSCNGIAT